MELASRIFSALLGLAVVVFLVWPINFPLGFQQAWRVRDWVVLRIESTPPPPSAVEPSQADLAVLAPKVGAPREPHAIPNPGAPKGQALVPEKEDAERLAALQGKNKAVAEPKPKTKRYYRVVVRDGGTIEAGGVVIRLDGILARGADAQCMDKRGKAWPCGARARVALMRLIRARAVTCELPGSGARKSFTARCAVGGTDLSAWMVRQGWAKPKQPPKPALADAAQAARQKRIGLWRSAE